MSAETRPPDPSDSYAHRTRQSGPDLEDRNVLIVRIRKSSAALNRNFDDSVCEIMCRIIGVRPIQDTIGCQYLMDRGDVIVEIWLKENIQASRFSSDIWREICPGFDIVSVHPALSKEVTLLILDLPLNIKDKVVREYVAKFGGKLAPQPPQFVKAKSGIWVGQPNGDRKYKADFSGQIVPMGTYHFLGGRRIRIIYNGNTRTCGRCHQPPTDCPGDGIASKCRDKEGPQVHIHEHMRRLDTILSQARNNASQARDDEAQVDNQQVQEDHVEDFPPNPPIPTQNSESTEFPPNPPPAPPTSQSVDQSQPAIIPGGDVLPLDQSEPAASCAASNAIPHSQSESAAVRATSISTDTSHSQSESAASCAANNSTSISQSQSTIPMLKELARSQVPVAGQLEPKTAGTVQQPGPGTDRTEKKDTGTIPRIPGLNLTKSQKKREKNRERKRKQRAAMNIETEALDTSTEDKLSQRMMNWIQSSKKHGRRNQEENSLVEYTGTKADTEESDESDNIDDKVQVEKDSFHKKVLEGSHSKSFFEDNPFETHSTETYKSVFANRLSLTPRITRPTASSSSTPKRNRSPSPSMVNGIKSIRKE